MTASQALPLATTLITAGLLMALWFLMQEFYPRRPVPVYLVDGAMDRLAQAIRDVAGEEQIGLIDADGYLVVRGERFICRFEGLEEHKVFARRRELVR